jgi:hypothetical protein
MVARLDACAPEAVPEELAGRAAAEATHGRRRAALHQGIALAAVEALAREGIPAAPLKGALLGEEIYGDPGLRPSADIDLLVSPEDLPRALKLLERRGYEPSRERPWMNGLPLLHHALEPRQEGLPTIEVHWRIHWYETSFSAALLGRSVPDPARGRRFDAADELALLLLFFARDSFFGLRLAADLAAWWDLHGQSLPERALDRVMLRHPELRLALVTAVGVAQHLVGLPAERVLSPLWELGSRGAAAARLANWEQRGSDRQIAAKITAVDWLLAPPSQRRAFVRRNIFQPPLAFATAYGLPEDAHVRQNLHRLLRGSARAVKFGYGYGRSRWEVRGDRECCPVPTPLLPAGRAE